MKHKSLHEVEVALIAIDKQYNTYIGEGVTRNHHSHTHEIHFSSAQNLATLWFQ